MPYTSFTFEVVAGNQAEASKTVESGFVASVMMNPERVGTGNAEYYGQIFIATTETPRPHPVALLASGYFGATSYIGWTGRIQLDPSYVVLARVYSESAIPVRCSIITQES